MSKFYLAFHHFFKKQALKPIWERYKSRKRDAMSHLKAETQTTSHSLFIGRHVAQQHKRSSACVWGLFFSTSFSRATITDGDNGKIALSLRNTEKISEAEKNVDLTTGCDELNLNKRLILQEIYFIFN
ncbi:hypothetical protein NPIL_44941 [Nephila pilipes]|uniref:Uncharacterized protein n=1 Tax=Nephila pilipes TaxID=299642 RepID=A0A8X6UH62_NEPPI|nr:hypothetical protein NPIL_44941 [Nephila pilipes]